MVTVTKRSSKKTKNRQTLTPGTKYDRAADLKRKAKVPGVRESKKTGKRYVERRRNRSDVPPGRL